MSKPLANVLDDSMGEQSTPPHEQHQSLHHDQSSKGGNNIVEVIGDTASLSSSSNINTSSNNTNRSTESIIIQSLGFPNPDLVTNGENNSSSSNCVNVDNVSQQRTYFYLNIWSIHIYIHYLGMY